MGTLLQFRCSSVGISRLVLGISHQVSTESVVLGSGIELAISYVAQYTNQRFYSTRLLSLDDNNGCRTWSLKHNLIAAGISAACQA